MISEVDGQYILACLLIGHLPRAWKKGLFANKRDALIFEAFCDASLSRTTVVDVATVLKDSGNLKKVGGSAYLAALIDADDKRLESKK